MERNILAVIDGSPDSETVCEWARTLGEDLQYEIQVQAIIDDQLLLGLSGFDGTASLCGSGVFIAAQSSMIDTMVDLYESIILSFSARVEGHLKHQMVTNIDHGKLVECVTARAQQSELIIMGQNCADREQVRWICQQTGCPILVVSKQSGTEQVFLPGGFVSNSALSHVISLLSHEKVA